jgi:capsular exopolysaccharide synthesis family protein
MTLPRQSTTESRLPAGLMSLTILQVLGTVWRRKWIIAACTLVALSGAIIANGVVTPLYTATASIIVEPRQQKIVEFDSVLSNLPVSLETMESEVQVIQSPALAKQVVDTLGLSALAEFNPALEPSEDSIADDVKTAVKGLFTPVIAWLREGQVDRRGVELAQAQSPGAWDLPPDELRRGTGETRVINRFLRNLQVEIQGSSRVITVSYTTTDPQLSQQIANAIAQNYIQDQVRLKNDIVADANSFLGSRMEKLRADVEAAERRVEEFRETTPIVSEEDGTLLAEQIYSMNRTQIDAQLELDTVNERLARLEAAMSRRGSTAAFDGVESTVIDQLRLEEMRLRQEESQLLSTLGPKHPQVVTLRSELQKRRQQMLEEAQRLHASLRNEQQIAQQRLNSIHSSVRKLQGNSDTLNAAQIQLRALQREADATREVFEAFLTRYKETAQLDYDQALARVLSLASIPTGPSFPKTTLNYVIAVVLGCAVGAAIILLLELSVRGFRGPEELQEATGLPVLAAIPRVAPRNVFGPGLARFLEEEPNSAFAEAHKGVYAQLRVDRRALGLGNVLLITSSAPNEGKSVFSRSLSASLAGGGLNVLLIDCDLRASEEELRLGLSDFVLGECPLEQAVQVDEKSTLSRMAPGTPVADPLAVLRSPKLAKFLEAAAQQYDLVCLDAPPVLAVSDAATLAELADQVVVVVRWMRTPRHFVSATLQRLQRCRAHISGVVMTQAKLTRSAKTNPYLVGYADRSFRKYY